jgi:hypothetical protein
MIFDEVLFFPLASDDDSLGPVVEHNNDLLFHRFFFRMTFKP